jgi:hypothetical protein
MGDIVFLGVASLAYSLIGDGGLALSAREDSRA